MSIRESIIHLQNDHSLEWSINEEVTIRYNEFGEILEDGLSARRDWDKEGTESAARGRE